MNSPFLFIILAMSHNGLPESGADRPRGIVGWTRAFDSNMGGSLPHDGGAGANQLRITAIKMNLMKGFVNYISP